MLAGTLDPLGLASGAGTVCAAAALGRGENHPWTRQECGFVTDFRAKVFVGSPGKVRTRLDALVAETGAGELMATTMAHDHALRKRSDPLLAEVFALNASQRR